MSDKENNGFTGGQMVIALVGGAALGAGVALLLAPRSGAETRAEIRALADSTRTRAMRLPHAVAGAVEAGAESLSGSLNDAVKAAKTAAHA